MLGREFAVSHLHINGDRLNRFFSSGGGCVRRGGGFAGGRGGSRLAADGAEAGISSAAAGAGDGFDAFAAIGVETKVFDAEFLVGSAVGREADCFTADFSAIAASGLLTGFFE